ncbi:hypothetical protein MSG28_009508 [Choristoneura fumiferana]|uniref:Uncharacterized protein n=1 Tax=Choristoneura fumiferana TaxID=7141 RepID=A0ACC0JBI0_CHOFU|nr:hypothetical protein MSG28_009508 [Choristoneura fumiferana]
MDDVPYLVYVGDTVNSEAHKSASQLQSLILDSNSNVANDADIYEDAEYLESSTENENDSSSEDVEPEFNNDVEMMEIREPTVKVGIAVPQSSSKWTHEATVGLIEAFRSYETSLITGTINISEVWDEVASKLQEKGWEFTPLHCKKKFVSLKQIYEKIKEQEIQSGKSVKKWMYLDLIQPIMTKYRSYTTDAWDSAKYKDVKSEVSSVDDEDKQKFNQSVQGTYKWVNSAILLLIDQYRKYQSALESGSISQKVLFRLVEKAMQKEGYNVTASQCLIKYNSLKKTYRSIKEYNQVNRLIPRSWRYYDLIEMIVQGTPEVSDRGCDPLEEVSETLAEIKSEETVPPNIFKWSRRAIEILAAEYREHRPPLQDCKVSRNKVWQIVAQKLRKAGYNVTIGQCKSKISGMLKLYKRKRAGARSRAWSERGNWYSKIIESLVEKIPKSSQREVPKRVYSENREQRQQLNIESVVEKTPKSVQREVPKRADNMLDQLIICEENKERRHRENREQRQQLIDIMRHLVDKLE